MDENNDDAKSCGTVEMNTDDEGCVWCGGEGCDECNGMDEFENPASSTMSSDVAPIDPRKKERQHRLEEAKYKVHLDKADIEAIQEDKVDYIANLACVHRGLADAFLREFSWNTDKIEAKLLQVGGSRALATEYELPFVLGKDDDEEEQEIPITATDKCCVTLCENTDTSQLRRMWCGHIVCTDCLEGSIQACLVQNDASDSHTAPLTAEMDELMSVRCPALAENGKGRCRAPLPLDLVVQLLPAEMRASTEQELLNRKIHALPGIFRCPRAECHYGLHIPLPVQVTDSHAVFLQERDVTCLCDGSLCGICGHEYGHEPAPCDFVEIFQRVMDPERRTREFLEAATKPCPKCGVMTEKNRNCNHMTCQKCKHEYCWLCGVAWRQHSGGSYYTCEAFARGQLSEKKQKEEEQRQKMNVLQQLICAQEKMCELCMKQVKTIDQLLMQRETRQLFPVLPRLRDALLTCRKAYVNLHWCFALIPFLPTNESRCELFLSHQETLLKRTEELKELILSKKDNFRVFEESGLYARLMKAIDSVAHFRVQLLQSVKELNVSDLIKSTIDRGDSGTTVPWACIRCQTKHKGATPIFTLEENTNSKAAKSLSVDGIEPYRDPNTGRIFCGNERCRACKAHSEVDCRACLPR